MFEHERTEFAESELAKIGTREEKNTRCKYMRNTD